MSCTQTVSYAAPCARHRHAALEVAREALGRCARKIAVWITRYQTRRVLRELDAHLLKDIGVTPEQAGGEAAKPFWID